MNVSAALLDRAKATKGLTSDYKLAQALDWSVSFVSNLRTGQRVLTEDAAEELATFADIDLVEVTALIRAERAKTPTLRAAWAKIAEKRAA